MYIYIAPNRQKSSEVLAAKQMSFKLFLRMCQWKATRSAVPPGVCSVSLAHTAKLRRPIVVLVPGMNDECPAVRRAQLPLFSHYT